MTREERSAKFLKIMKEKDTNCYQIERKVKVTRQTMYQIIHCSHTPSAETIIKLEDCMHLDRGTLL